MTGRFRAALLVGIASTALVSPAAAQETVAAPDGQASLAPNVIDDIVVTAQRRSERAQDVPIVISAFSAEALRELNISEPQDLYGNVPSLVVGTQGQGSRDVQSYSIRGQSTGFLALPSVASYLSEVPLIAAISLSLQGGPGLFVDLANVQVLSGPQGTLFGRNTTGGAVLFTPQRPTDRFDGYIQGSIGNLDLRSVEGALNVPVIEDKLAIRVAGAYYDRRGFTRDLVWDKWRDDQHWYTGRLGILMRPTETISNYLMVYGSRSSNDGTGYINRGFRLPSVVAPCNDAVRAPNPASCDVYRRQMEIANQIGPRATRQDLDTYAKIDAWGAINTTDVELNDELTLRNIISYQKLKSDYASDQDGTPLQARQNSQNGNFPTFPVPGLTDEFGIAPNGYANNLTAGGPRDYLKQFTEELQLQGKMLDGNLNFTVGGFYINTEPASLWYAAAVQFCAPQNTGNGILCPGSRAITGVTNRSKALYAQGTFDFGALSDALDSLRLTAGYRYTWDTAKGFSVNFTPLANGTFRCSSTNRIVTAIEACRYEATLKTSAPTWTVGLDYRPVRDLMLYGKITRGYKAGGFNTTAVNEQYQTFDPEVLTSYEAGFKSDWRVGSVPGRLNVTYYYSDYRNIQRPGTDFNPTTFAGGAKILAAKATVQGLEAEASFRPFPGLEIGGTVSHTDADYKEFEYTSLFGDFTCLPGGGFGRVTARGRVDARCMPFQFVSPWIYNIRANAEIPIAPNMGHLNLLVSYSHFAAQATAPAGDPSFEPGSVLEPYGLLNASLDWRNVAESGFDVGLFINNAANKLYRVGNTNSFDGLGINSTLYGEPRTYGVKLSYRFGQE